MNVSGKTDLAHTTELSMRVPDECVPALKGLRGAKIKDTEGKSGTQIIISPHGNSQHIVLITGESYEKCLLARRIMQHSVDHYLASLRTEAPVCREGNRSDALLDLATFYSEVMDRKVV